MTNYPTTTGYTKQTAAHILRIVAALITVVKAGVAKPTKLKQQTIDFLAVSEVAVLRGTYADSANTRSCKATELKNLLRSAVSNRETLKVAAVALLPFAPALATVDHDYQRVFRVGRFPEIQIVFDLLKGSDGSEGGYDTLRTLATEQLSASEFSSFRALVMRFMSEYSIPLIEENVERNAIKVAKVVARLEEGNQKEFKPGDLINLAVSVLAKPAEYRWEAVSCAVALATGRRMVEVHLTGLFWVPTDDEWNAFATRWSQQIGADKLPERSSCLAFKGQAKGKARKVEAVELKDVVWIFPTLVEPALVLKGIEHLQLKGKRLESPLPEKLVNDRYSKHLSAEVKRRWPVVDDVSECTYHKLRAAYFCTTSGRMELSNTQFTQAAQLLIGDGDITTIQSYQRYQITE